MKINRDLDKIALVFFILTISLILAGGVAYVVKYKYPSGSDISLHLRLSQGWLNLDVPLFDDRYFSKGLFPYPPAFHLTLAALSLAPLVGLIDVANILQVILFPSILLTTFYLVYKKKDTLTAVISVLILATSPAFWDRGAQVIPQAVDLLLFPMAILFYTEKKNSIFIAISSYLLYSHWLYSGLFVISLLAYTYLYEKERLKIFYSILLACLPLILLMLYYTPALIKAEVFIPETGGINEPQELGVITEPLFAIKYLGYPLFILTIILIIHMGFKKPDRLGKLTVFWGIGLIPMLIFFPDRFIEYVAQPLAILSGLMISDLFGYRGKGLILVCVFLYAVLSQYYFYQALIINGEVWMPLDSLSPFVR